jgi:putative tryptophan/tyrosine transport system substrate-binding protein
MQFHRFKRREFIALLSGAAAAPFGFLDVHAQQAGRMRRIGVLLNITAEDQESQIRLAAFAQGLQLLGWIVGQNVRAEYRWGGGSADAISKYAAELVALAPDVILAQSTAAVAPLLKSTHTIPIVFTVVADPVGAGYVQTLARPGGNATGFTGFEYAFAGKWLELLKEIAPPVTRVAVLRESESVTGPAQFGAIQAVAPTLGVELRPVDTRNAEEIERAITAFARDSNGGIIVTGSPAATVHRKTIVALAARHRLPSVYYTRYFAAEGGLISYGPDFVDQFRRAAGYVDRILKGEKPADLPVQAPTKYETVLNLKTAKALGLAVPTTVLARADEVIE